MTLYQNIQKDLQQIEKMQRKIESLLYLDKTLHDRTIDSKIVTKRKYDYGEIPITDLTLKAFTIGISTMIEDLSEQKAMLLNDFDGKYQQRGVL